jgi:hypothetical protein
VSSSRCAVLILCGGFPVLAQKTLLFNDGHVFFDTRISSDSRNVQTGGRIGDEEQVGDFRVGGFLDMDFRPVPSGTRITLLQSKEWYIKNAPYSLGPGMAVFYPWRRNLFLTAATGASYAFAKDGDSRGDPGWAGWVDLGIRVPWMEFLNWGVAYQYHPLSGVPDHRMALQFRMRAI